MMIFKSEITLEVLLNQGVLQHNKRNLTSNLYQIIILFKERLYLIILSDICLVVLEM